MIRNYNSMSDADEYIADDHESYNDKFPEELREEMIARVAGVTQLCRLRLVCKAWNGVITSASLARLHATRHGDTHQPWLLIAKHPAMVTLRQFIGMTTTDALAQKSKCRPMLYLCDPASSCSDQRHEQQPWVAPLPLPFLHETPAAGAAASASASTYNISALPMPAGTWLDLSTCKSHGGLVCCIASCTPPHNYYSSAQIFGRARAIFIFNPVTRAYKMLPTPASFRWAAGNYNNRRRDQVIQGYHEYGEEETQNLDLALWRSRSTGHFKVAMCDRDARVVRVFDSSRGAWREGNRPPDAGGLRPRFQGFRDRRNRERLYWYDVETDAWFATRLPEAAEGRGTAALRAPSVFKGEDGSVMLAAVLGGGSGGAVGGFGVWAEAASGGDELYTAGEIGSRSSLQLGPRRTKWVAVSSSSSTPCRSASSNSRRSADVSMQQQQQQNMPMIIARHDQRGPMHMHRLRDSKLICHAQGVCLTGLLRLTSLWPWRRFYPCILTFNAAQRTWNWVPHYPHLRAGRKTWAKFQALALLTPDLQGIP